MNTEMRKALLDTCSQNYTDQPINNRLVMLTVGTIDTLLQEAGGHHALFQEWFGNPSVHDLTPAQKFALLTWAKPGVVDGRWVFDQSFIEEISEIAE